MAVDFSKPNTGLKAVDYTQAILDMFYALAVMFDGSTIVEVPIGCVRWNSSTNKFEKWNGSYWAPLTYAYDINVTYLQGKTTADFAMANHTHTGIYQPKATNLDTFAGISMAENYKLLYTNGSGISLQSFNAFTASLLGAADVLTFRNLLGLTIGTNIQAYSANLAKLAGLNFVNPAEKMFYTTTGGTLSLATITSLARTFLAAADSTTQKMALGLGTAAYLDTGVVAGKIPVMASGNKYPAANGSLITNLTAGNITGLIMGLSGQALYLTAGTFNWTVPAGITSALVTVIGGGGGSGGSSNLNGYNFYASSGGGGGGFSKKLITGLTPGATVAVTVGAGGLAGAANGAGGNGGTSSFGSYATATGGTGSAVGGPYNSADTPAGGNGTTSGGLNIQGETGKACSFEHHWTMVDTGFFNTWMSGDYGTQNDNGYLIHGQGGRTAINMSVDRPIDAAASGIGLGAGGKYTTNYNDTGFAGAPGMVLIEY